MTLHTVNLLPDHPDCSRCIRQLDPSDCVAFLGRGAWIANSRASWHLAWVQSGSALYVLQDDLHACGIAEHCAPGIIPIDLDEFIALTEEQTRQRAWF